MHPNKIIDIQHYCPVLNYYSILPYWIKNTHKTFCTSDFNFINHTSSDLCKFRLMHINFQKLHVEAKTLENDLPPMVE